MVERLSIVGSAVSSEILFVFVFGCCCFLLTEVCGVERRWDGEGGRLGGGGGGQRINGGDRLCC